MKTWVVLLRGINVGGKNILPMKELRDLLTASGFEGVKTYIQSGNCIVQSDEVEAQFVSKKVSKVVGSKFGFAPKVMTLALDSFKAAIDNNPYPQGKDNPKCLHFYFLSASAQSADMKALNALATETEQFTLTDEVLYLYAPDGIGRSKFAARAESKLGVATTTRNFRTVLKITDMLP